MIHIFEGGDKYLNNAERITKCGLFTKLIYKIVAFDMSDLDLPQFLVVFNVCFSHFLFSVFFLWVHYCDNIITTREFVIELTTFWWKIFLHWYFFIWFLDWLKDIDAGEPSDYTTIIVVKLEHTNLDSIFTNQHKYNQIRVQVIVVSMTSSKEPPMFAFCAHILRGFCEMLEAAPSIIS